MLRPKAEVLPESALLPDENLKPPPKRFTHRVAVEQPFYLAAAQVDATPAGRFAVGTRLLLLEQDAGPLCRVQDERGICALTPIVGLRPLR
jgi:hypothetical protein